jgi:hypothetical protein
VLLDRRSVDPQQVLSSLVRSTFQFTNTAHASRPVKAPGYRERTLALLGAGLVPTALGTALAVVHLAVIADAGGITVNYVPVTPSVAEMAQVPAITAASFAAGVAVARTIKHRAAGLLWGAIATYLFLGFWMLPWFPVWRHTRRRCDRSTSARLPGRAGSPKRPQSSHGS